MTLLSKNESNFEFSLRLTRAIKDYEEFVIHIGDDGEAFIDSKTVLDLIYDAVIEEDIPADVKVDDVLYDEYSYYDENSYETAYPAKPSNYYQFLDHQVDADTPDAVTHSGLIQEQEFDQTDDEVAIEFKNEDEMEKYFQHEARAEMEKLNAMQGAAGLTGRTLDKVYGGGC